MILNLICKNCGKTITKSRPNAKFCNKNCQYKNWKKDNLQKIRDYATVARAKHPDRIKEYTKKGRQKQLSTRMKRVYGIDFLTAQKMLEIQDGKCLICGRNIQLGNGNRSMERGVIDHSHQRNVVRAILCGKCNIGIGFFNDDINLFERAISYLKQKENI